jgi:hypothetical protein
MDRHHVTGTLLKLAAIISATLLLVRALYTTETGNVMLRLIPDSAWNAVYARLNLEGAETTANAELAVWLIACFIVSITLVLGGSLLLRRFFSQRIKKRAIRR